MYSSFPESWWKIRQDGHLTSSIANSVFSTKGEMTENLSFFIFQEKELFILVSKLGGHVR